MSEAHRALVVDDDAGIRILIGRVLAQHGFAVDSARDGAEAIEKMLQHDYVVITLDLMMPRIDGFAVVKYLTERWPEKLQNVIVTTAFGASALQQVCPPVARFVEKPFDINALVAEATECLQSALAQNAPSRAAEGDSLIVGDSAGPAEVDDGCVASPTPLIECSAPRLRGADALHGGLADVVQDEPEPPTASGSGEALHPTPIRERSDTDQ
ncbi:MAG TPA: response regulator [Thermoanaerobaculia bacterium]|nr:response regulator [Thermoanaerobaculia bacterium]